MSEITQFKQYVETELEKRINELPDLGYDLPEIRKYKKRVASATFAYENEEVHFGCYSTSTSSGQK